MLLRFRHGSTAPSCSRTFRNWSEVLIEAGLALEECKFCLYGFVESSRDFIGVFGLVVLSLKSHRFATAQIRHFLERFFRVSHRT